MTDLKQEKLDELYEAVVAKMAGAERGLVSRTLTMVEVLDVADADVTAVFLAMVELMQLAKTGKKASAVQSSDATALIAAVLREALEARGGHE